MKAKTEKQSLTQQHDVQMAMKTLEHEGFLRGPGLLQLETIKTFFAIINEKPKFRAHMKSVTDFCNEGNPRRRFRVNRQYKVMLR